MTRLIRLIAGVLACVLVLAGCQKTEPAPTVTQPVTQSTTAPTESIPETEPSTGPLTEPPITKVSTATVGTTGDILLHDLVIQSGYDEATGSYNYDNIFKFLTAYASRVDFAVANLEVTLCGEERGYKGYPSFNSPDAIVDSLKAAGFDMLLTANNHCYDTGHEGFHRTQQVIKEKELLHLGTRQAEEDANYRIQNINGINVGMICYTYNTSEDDSGKVSLNGIPLSAADSKLVNSFNYYRLDSFYEKLSGELAQMKEQGADVTMLFIHWGNEYQTYTNSWQDKISQQLCELGVDVIVGNHAHVIQPIRLLTSEADENRKTLCLYSTGNAVSNIYKVANFPVHTEDGMLFNVTFAKYSDGTVIVERAEVLPTWVHRYWDDDLGKRMYTILPMSGQQEAWQQEMGLTDSLLQKCIDSRDRTAEIVGAGLNEANEWYAQNQQAIEQLLGVTE